MKRKDQRQRFWGVKVENHESKYQRPIDGQRFYDLIAYGAGVKT
jgi:hypothetical protein